MKIRFKIIIYFLLVLMAALVLRLYFLQVMSGEVYAEMASESITREKSILAPRGNIYDRDGRLLVKSIPVSAVAVEPYLVAGDENTIQMLSDSLEMPVEDIKKKLDESNVSYLESVILKIDIDPSTMIYLKEYGSRLPGVEVIDIFLREYKYDYLASHILGYTGEIDPYRLSQEKYRNYVGGDQIGLTGIEEFYEYQLSGEKGKIVYEVDPEGKVVWRLTQEDVPDVKFYWINGIQRLPNGNTVVGNWFIHQRRSDSTPFFEVTPDKKVVWKMTMHQRMVDPVGIQMLDVTDATRR